MTTTASEDLAHAFVRDCTDYRCRKCAARVRWYRRKGPRSGKNRTRRHTGRT